MYKRKSKTVNFSKGKKPLRKSRPGIRKPNQGVGADEHPVARSRRKIKRS